MCRDCRACTENRNDLLEILTKPSFDQKLFEKEKNTLKAYRGWVLGLAKCTVCGCTWTYADIEDPRRSIV